MSFRLRLQEGRSYGDLAVRLYCMKAIKIKIQSGVACCMFSLASTAESRGAVVVFIVSICLMLMCWRIWRCAWGVLGFGTTHPLYTR
jgi:hypothetical protein